MPLFFCRSNCASEECPEYHNQGVAARSPNAEGE